MKQHFNQVQKRWIIGCLSLFLLLHVHAQSMQLKGHITDAAAKKPVASATVENTTTKKSVLTDTEGNFSIAANKNDQLSVSYVGYQTKKITVNDDAFLSIEIISNENQLTDVVVTALGVKKEIKRLGYSIQEVKGEDLIKARDQNPITGLTGKVAGLSVGASAELLRKPTVILRGNELSLYVVDGVPISSDTWNISPDDIESYTVLKGPAAAALYGSRAQYGAILITTKKGLKTKGFTVELNSTNSIDQGFLAFPRLQDEYGPGENQLYAFGNGKGGGLFDNDYDVWGPRFDGRLLPQYDGKYDPNTTYTTTYPGGLTWTGNIEPTPWIARGKNNLGNFLRTGFQTTNNIALNATGDNYSLRFSLSHSYQQSMIPNMELNITNFNMFGSYNVSKRLKIDANLNFNRQYTPNYPDVDYGPNSLLYNVAVWTGADWDVNAPDIRGEWQTGKVGTQSVFAEYQRYHNPWFMVNEWLRGHYKSDIYGYVSGNYKIDDHLNVNLRTQISTYDLLRTEKMPFSAHPYGREGNMGDYREDRRNLFESNSDIQLNYNYTVAKFLNLSGLVGGNARLFNYNSSWTSTDYLNIPNVYSFSNSLNPIQASSFNADMRVYSAYYSLDASLGKYATISVTGRVDKSSALPKGNNSYFYPSISASSVISDYVKMPDVISFLKVRASYAAVHGDATSSTVGTAPFNSITAFGTSPSGNSLYDYPLDYGNNYLSPYGGPDYSLVALYNTSKPYNNQTAAYYSGNLYDPNIKTFNRVSYEAGIDVKFLKNRLGFSATGFQYIDGPRILQNPISSATGYNYYYLNALKTKKTGYELSLSGTPIKTKSGINWNVLVNWSTFQDKYDELPPGQATYNTFFHAGDRVDAFYSSAFVKTTDGKIVFDAAGKPLVNPVSQFLGYLNADFQWSIYNNISWKNLSIGFQFDGSVGGVTTDYMHNKTMRGGRNIETVQGAFGEARLSDDGHAGDASYPGIYVGDGVAVSNGVAINYNSETGEILNYKDLQFAPNTQVTLVQDYISKYYNVSEANLMSKSYAKLREVTITYNFPQQWIQRSFINKLSVSLIGRNLLYFYADKRFKDVDLDQYNYSTGGTGLQSPTTRRYGLNINVVF
ncbi:SusC/RagA family TonB-linked outer membrane protein [Panacibacter ginsenosidivorans]|uniref:SusC/RagA family TonB-linked outer membrane protein n=1 Tax=Panacibacter ginsenosidivorans TaxID=1813871 RepID=A0A5B8V7J4_9BACT|nr:SusC/RagA family TonB-linked outer membrane protein [Panacibacter ginsenosidivorans]QEC67125.1 SusC/RagA family TonB-linked outer membrane protein [Panacibacter ginsenosidivorans]